MAALTDFAFFPRQHHLHASCPIHNTGPVVNTCETRKIAVTDGDGSDGDVIVLNPVNDSACNLQCAVGWYHSQHGNQAPFSCAPETKDRRSSEGIPTDPVTCSSACVTAFFVNMHDG